MRPSLVSSSLFLITSFSSTVTALEALGNSPCAAHCGNSLGGTSGNDIVCPDNSYTSTEAGQTFSSCITCQLGSKYQDPVTNQTDLQLGLYNLRYAMSWCLFGDPNNTAVGDTPCITSTACGPLQGSIEYELLAPNASEYSYCSGLLGSASVSKCNACLSVQSTEYYLNNFLTALNAACIQQPAPGNTISIEGTLFSTTPVNITSPTHTPTGVSSSKGGLPLVGKIAIVIGAVAIVCTLAGFYVIWIGRRRRAQYLRNVQRESGYSDWMKYQQYSPESGFRSGPSSTATLVKSPFREFFDSLDTQPPRAQRSPRSVDNESMFGEKAYFSPYASQFSTPGLVTELVLPGKDLPAGRNGSGGGRTSGRTAHTGGRVQSRSRSREKKVVVSHQVEVQNVAPALVHPGHGRGRSLRLTEEDVKRGGAL